MKTRPSAALVVAPLLTSDPRPTPHPTLRRSMARGRRTAPMSDPLKVEVTFS